MVASRIENESYLFFEGEYFYDELQKVIQSVVPRFDRLVKQTFYFHLLFSLLFIIEISLFFGFFSFIVQSSIVSICLSAIFFTLFSYLVLRFYIQSKKKEQYHDFVERFSRGAKSLVRYRKGIPEHHFALAGAYYKLSIVFQDMEYTHFRIRSSWFDTLAQSLEKFSCSCFWQDYLSIREMLLKSSIEEYLNLVRCEPTNLTVHVSLASCYVSLSSLYMDPRKSEDDEEHRWKPSARYSDEFEEKFRITAKKAIEEFKVLNDYAPNDPWVHNQLAYCYHDLKMPQEEIVELETIRKLRPDDKENLHKLGKLYFEQGMNSKGLKVYEELRNSRYQKADELICLYGKHSQ